MKNYLKLVDFELKRFWKMYAVLLGLLVITEFVSFMMQMNSLKSQSKTYGNGIGDWPLEGFTFSIFSVVVILLIIAILVIYIFFTWYREWFSKHTFAFQLLVLPFDRMTVYYAKLTALLLFIFGCIAIQLLMYPIFQALYVAIVPEVAQVDSSLVSWVGGSPYIYMLIPVWAKDFALFYGLGITSVIVIFTVILIERSFRIRGIILGVLFVIFNILILLLPMFVNSIVPLYENEMTIFTYVNMVIIIAISLVISTRLINKRIWV
ncbi:hypothetical protein [Bacillus massiliigorillae]|uniref:hypothetical protein n=1 Tax=Bacillus massiliigorillae TaxID=1243664 RepID=UPI0003A22B32|nr:hypothetical protein [Bacillus massiliigorillae]